MKVNYPVVIYLLSIRKEGSILKNKVYILALLFLIWSLMVSTVCSADIKPQTMVTVLPDQILTGPVFLHGQDINVHGTIDGDLYVAGQNINIDAAVKGDIIAAGQSLTIAGPVEGDIRLAGQSVSLIGKVTGSASIACQTLRINDQAEINRDLFMMCADASVDGKVGRFLQGAANSVTISGVIGNSIRLHNVGSLRLMDGSQVNGDLAYSSPQKAIISPNAKLQGKENWTQVNIALEEPSTREKQRSWGWFGLGITGFIISLCGSLLVWWVVRLWRPSAWQTLSKPIEDKFGGSLGMGILLLLATPVMIVLLLITVIGIPLALILFVIYLLLLYLSKIIVAQALGDYLSKRRNMKMHSFWIFLMSLVFLMLLISIPFIGWILSIAVLSLGIGSTFGILSRRKDESSTPIPSE